MSRIGILTLYHKNNNYGGQLQAYALNKAVQELGYSSEQISFERNRKKLYFRKIRGIFEESVTKDIFAVKLKLFLHRNKSNGDDSNIQTLRKFEEFQEFIPHSPVFTEKNISETNKIYDLFIVGSDQVWNPLFATKEYFFDFVEQKPCISYAASIRINHFEKAEGRRIKKYLDKFSYISVREKRAIQTLKEIGVDKEIEVMPDPTLLLSKEKWLEIVDNREPEYDYIVVYLVRDDVSINMIRKYAQENGYKVMFIPEPGYYFEKDDIFVKIKDGVGPREFVQLISKAKLVIANSFHGTVFSIIFNRPFYVYGNIEIDDRKGTLLKQFGLQDRLVKNDYDFCKHKDNICIDYSKVNDKLLEIREFANQRIREVLEKVTDN